MAARKQHIFRTGDSQGSRRVAKRAVMASPHKSFRPTRKFKIGIASAHFIIFRPLKIFRPLPLPRKLSLPFSALSAYGSAWQ